MRSLYFYLAALAMTAPAYTQTAPPAPPSVTAGAEFKGLRFDWESVHGAAWYQLEYRAHQTGPFVQLGANYAGSTTYIRFRLPLHLFDWTWARYRIAACNSAGCARSNEVSVDALRRDAVGYFKTPAPNMFEQFGSDTDISPDGLNFVAAATSDIQGDGRTGAAFVFRRNSAGQWAQRARLLPTVAPIGWFETTTRVSISADGDTVVMGVPDYQHGENDAKTGEVFVFHFNGGSWTRTRLLSGNRGRFGRWVAINDAGDTIATPYSEGTPRVAIYKLIDGAWKPIRGISNRAGVTEYCEGDGVLSNDGSTVAEICAVATGGYPVYRDYVRTHSGPNWTVREEVDLHLTDNPRTDIEHHALAIDGTGNTIVAQLNDVPSNPNQLDLPSEVQVFSRTGGAYARVATFKPGPWRDPEDRITFGRDVAISSDGSTIAIGDVLDDGFGTGPRAAPLTPRGGQYGAVYVYRLKSSWVLANMVKPNFRPPRSDYILNTDYFGRELSLNGNGQTLIVGAPDESRTATGIGGDWTQGGLQSTGAVFMY
ncbi:MAG TPA: hypothetical protein VM146_10255 [Steroidobacteraceae bacterium]|nr:hypothetical protein [Steroidobacteraceae bacterium]